MLKGKGIGGQAVNEANDKDAIIVIWCVVLAAIVIVVAAGLELLGVW